MSLARQLLQLAAVLAAIGCAASTTTSTPSGQPASQAPSIDYTIALPAPQTQMVEMSMRVPRVSGAALDVHLPTWRPGRYHILDMASTVREVTAASNGGAALPVRKTAKSTWRIETQGHDEIVVRYRVYANSIADRTRHADSTHAFLSGSSVFLYVEDRLDHPVRVRIEAPDGWATATSLETEPGAADVLVAPSYHVLIDSPLEIGLHDRLVFEVDGRPHEIIIWPPGLDYDGERLQTDFAEIVRAQAEIFGGMPYERFVFLIHAGGGGGGGTEHLASTIMQTSRPAIEGSIDRTSSYKGFLGLVSHEMFHTWNVKQFRPAGIHPYDYARENYSPLFWVAEGTTSYYTPVTLVRTDLRKTDKYLKDLAKSVGSLRNRPGRHVQSLEESSFDAWIKFNASSPDDVNSEVSFYSKGALVSLMLDMEVRKLTGNAASLDSVMRAMYERFPLDGPGYTTEDLVRTLNDVSGANFTGFFDRYVRGTDRLTLEPALQVAGLELYFKPKRDDDDDDDENEDADEEGKGEEADDAGEDDEPAPIRLKAYLGLNASGTPARVRSVLSDGPAYVAGITSGDQILALNGRRVSGSEINKRLERFAPGDIVQLTYFHRDELRTIDISLGSRPDGAWTIRRVKEPTDEQVAVYESWLGQEWPGRKDDESKAEG